MSSKLQAPRDERSRKETLRKRARGGFIRAIIRRPEALSFAFYIGSVLWRYVRAA
jgi:hypothetical protein